MKFWKLISLCAVAFLVACGGGGGGDAGSGGGGTTPPVQSQSEIDWEVSHSASSMSFVGPVGAEVTLRREVRNISAKTLDLSRIESADGFLSGSGCTAVLPQQTCVVRLTYRLNSLVAVGEEGVSRTGSVTFAGLTPESAIAFGVSIYPATSVGVVLHGTRDNLMRRWEGLLSVQVPPYGAMVVREFSYGATSASGVVSCSIVIAGDHSGLRGRRLTVLWGAISMVGLDPELVTLADGSQATRWTAPFGVNCVAVSQPFLKPFTGRASAIGIS